MSKIGDVTAAGAEKLKESWTKLNDLMEAALERTAEMREEELALGIQLEALRGSYDNLAAVNERLASLRGKNTVKAREERAELQELKAAFEDAERTASALANSFGGLEEAMASLGGSKLGGYIGKLTGGLEKMEEQQRKLWAQQEAGLITQEKYTAAVQRGNLALYKFALSPFEKAFEKIFAKTLELATATIDATRSMQRFYGASEKTAEGLINMQYGSTAAGIELRRLGITGGTLFKTFEEMRGEFVLLSGATMEANQAFVEYGAVLEKVGVKTTEFAKISNTLNRVYGENAEGARTYAASLNQIGVDAGLGPGELVEHFNNLSPQLLKITGGTQALGQTMTNLAYASRQTGIEIGRIVDITSKFDTFEGAADSVGRMNAILGGDFLNVMDLMKEEDPAMRLKMMAQAASDGAGSFQDLQYHERLAITEAMGLKDVGELALVMSGNIDLMNNQFVKSEQAYVDAAKKARNFQKVQEQLQNLLIQVANTPGLAKSVIFGMERFVWFMDFFARHGKTVIAVLGTLTIVTKSLAAANVFLGIASHLAANGMGMSPGGVKFGLKGIGILGALMAIGFIIMVYAWGSSLIDVIYALSIAILAVGVAAKIGGKGISMGMVKTLLALGAAVLLAAVGIAIAAEGIGNMADSISRLNADQVGAFNNALIALVGTLSLFMTAVVLLGIFATGPQLLGILGIGAAFMMIGVGVGIAAGGMGKLAEGFAKLFENADGGALLGMAVGLYAMAGALTVFAASMVIFIPAMMMLSAAMAVGSLFGATPSEAEIRSFTKMTENLANLNADNLAKTVDQVAKLRKEMNAMMESPDMVKNFTEMLEVFERDMKLAYNINTKDKAQQKTELTISSPITIQITDDTQLMGKIDQKVLATMNFTTG